MSLGSKGLNYAANVVVSTAMKVWYIYWLVCRYVCRAEPTAIHMMTIQIIWKCFCMNCIDVPGNCCIIVGFCLIYRYFSNNGKIILYVVLAMTLINWLCHT